MRTEYPDYYSKFHCLAEACPDTCCKEWEVDVDEDTFYYYKVQEGAIGEKLAQNLKEEGDCKYIPLRSDGTCPFLTGEHLCELCSALGEEGMSQTCQEYPRYYMGIGSYEQIDLSLSCMETGRLLFLRTTPIQYVSAEDEEEAWEELSTEEEERLAGILQTRNDLIAALQTAVHQTAAPQTAPLQIAEFQSEEAEGCSSSVPADIGTAQKASECPAQERTPKIPEILPDAREDERLLELLSQMDVMNAEGGRILTQIREEYEVLREREAAFRASYGPLLQRLFTKFAVYLVYRYTIDSFYEGNLDAEQRLWRRSLRLVLLMCIHYEWKEGAFGVGSMIQLTHLFSRQVEHSDENVELMKSC